VVAGGQKAVASRRINAVGTLDFQVEPPRASDAERDQALGALRQGLGDGRLSHSAFLKRVDLALDANRRDELQDITADLPPGGWIARRVVDVVGSAALLKQQMRLAWRTPQLPRLRFPDPAPVPLRIGRGDECELRLGSDSVSRFHAELFFEDEQWILRDLRSTNGTTVNGWRITTTPVRPGDRVGFGPVVFRLSAR
jgi:hypothetical protein